MIIRESGSHATIEVGGKNEAGRQRYQSSECMNLDKAANMLVT